MAEEKWTPKMVADRLEEMASTLRRMPGDRPKGFISSWPPMIQEFLEEARLRRSPPLPDAITRMDECLEWLRCLEVKQMQIVWARAELIPWKEILVRVGVGRTKGWHLWMAALMQIANNLNARPGKVVRT